MLATTRIDSTVFAPSSEAKKSVVSSPRPLSFVAFGSFVAKRTPIAGRPVDSDSSRIFVAMIVSSNECVLSPVTVSSDASGAPGLRLVMLSESYSPPSICSSAIELIPTLMPIVGTRHKFPFSPDTG